MWRFVVMAVAVFILALVLCLGQIFYGRPLMALLAAVFGVVALLCVWYLARRRLRR